MQTINAALTAQLAKGQDDPRVLVDLLEFYPSDTIPSATGFDPADALETFSGSEITWNGIAYRREFKARGEVVRNMGEKTNSASLTFSNITRYMATWAQTQPIEGMFLVIRCVNPSVEDDSLVLFVGRCDKPGDIDKETFSLTARQDFGNINQTVPFHKFIAEDPDGRLPGDPLYQGFRFVTQSGTFEGTPTKTGGFFGLFKKKKRNTQQWSAYDETPYGEVVPEIFGSCQMEGIALVFQDRGNFTLGMWVWSKGPITSISNFAVKSDGRTLINTVDHLGDQGGTGTNATEDTLQAPGIGFLSFTAYTSAAFRSELDVVDDAPTVVALIQGRKIDLPDTSGVYNRTDWSDNPVHISRFILTHPQFVNIDPAFMEDSVNYLTGKHCDEFLIDDTNSQVIAIPSVETNQAGDSFKRFQSTAVVTSETIKYASEDLDQPAAPDPDNPGGPYTPYDPNDFPTFFPTQPLLIKRYTCNFPITDETRAVDLLYKTVFPSFKGYMVVNKYGRYEIRTEKASDATRVRANTIVGATSIPVLDVTPWKSGPGLLTGRLYVGVGLTTSEVRDLTSADYSTSGNSISLAAGSTGTTTATASGAFLSGGSTSVQASGTVTIGGTPAAGDTISATIDGVEVTYTLNALDDTETAAAKLSAYINATPRLRPYIKSFWDSGSPNVVTIKCLHGALNLSSTTGFPTLLLTHSAGIANPGSAPTAAAASGGTLAAGSWQLAYSDLTTVGSTALTPLTTVTVTANQQLNVSGLPALTGSARNFYLSEQANSTNLRFVTQRTNASDFSITSAPEPGAALPPSSNTTAEEVMRIAGSFATNSQDVYSAWPASTLVLLNDIYLPTVLNGHKYQVTTGGTTGSSEPTWPTTAGGTVASGSAVFTEIGTTVLAQAGLTRANIVKDSFKWPLGSTQSSVNQIKGNFRDRKHDFALTPFKVNDRAKQLQVKKVYPKEVDYSAVDSLNQVLRLANGELSKNVEGDWFDSFKTGPNGLTLEEGDLVCCSDDSGGLINVVTRIEDLRIHSDHNVSVTRARKYSTNMFSDDVGATVIPIPSVLRYIQTVDSIAMFIDSFAIRESDSLIPGFYIAVSRDLADLGDWRGWTLWADYGDGYVQIAEGDIPAVMGTADEPLGTTDFPDEFDTWKTFGADNTLDELDVSLAINDFHDDSPVQVKTTGTLPAPLAADTTYYVRDRGVSTFKLAATLGGAAIDITTDGTGQHSIKRVLDITLKYGTPSPSPDPFATVTEADLIANPYKNLFRVGNEYLQAATVASHGSNSFTLSDFYRGRFGTDATELTHTADEDVVFLNGAEVFVEIDPARAGIEYNYKVVTTNQDVADATAIPFTWTGGTVKPLRMSDPLVTKDASDHWLVQAQGHPRPAEEPASYEALFGTTSDWTDEATNTVLTLPMVTGTSQAALMASTTQEWNEETETFDTTSHAYKNNVASLLGALSYIYGFSIQAIVQSFQRFEFEMTLDGVVAGSGNLVSEVFGDGFGVALVTRATPTVGAPVEADCPLSVEWSVPVGYTGPENSVRETWRSYSTVLLVRDGIDPGNNPFDLISGEIVDTNDEPRKGPRYTFLVNGNEISAHQDYRVGGGHIVKVSMGDTVPYPMRLATWIPIDGGCFLRGAMFGGAIFPSTILSAADQVAAYGSVQSQINVRMRQVSLYPGVKGAPLDFTAG